MSSNISSSQLNQFTNMYSENKVFAIIKVRNKKKWTKEEDWKLIQLAEKNKEKHWKEISKHFLNKNPLQCFSRYKRIKPGIIKGTWSKEEDDKILSLVNLYGKSWSKLAKIMKTRNGKQIRDRFINVLDPEVKKGKFSYKEDKKIKELYLKYGPRWATIARGLPNRTPDMIKNRFHSSIKKYLHQKNFLSRGDVNKLKNEANSSSKKASSEGENNLDHSKLANLNSHSSNGNSSNYNCNSNSKSFIDRSYLNNFSGFSNSMNEQNLFQSKLNKVNFNPDIDNRINNGFRLNLDSKKENKNSIYKENYEHKNYQNEKAFNKNNNFNKYLQNEIKDSYNNGMIFNKIYSKIKDSEFVEDVNRTVSNSDFSEKNIGHSDAGLVKNYQTNENFENLFEHPDEQFKNGSFSNNKFNNNFNTTNIFDNSRVFTDCQINSQQYYKINNNEQINYTKKINANLENKLNNNFSNINNNLNVNYVSNDKIFLHQKNELKNKNNLITDFNPLQNSKNLNHELRTEEKNQSNQIINCQEFQMKARDFKSYNLNSEYSNKNNNLNSLNNFTKNEQEFKIEKTNKNQENAYFVNSKISNYCKEKYTFDESKIKENLSFQKNSNSQEIVLEPQLNQFYNNQQFSNENSRSTNLITYPNVSSNTSNLYSLEENENSSPDNLKKNNGNPYFINSFEDNYQMNFLNFPDSPYRMKSPRYFDFDEIFNNN